MAETLPGKRAHSPLLQPEPYHAAGLRLRQCVGSDQVREWRGDAQAVYDALCNLHAWPQEQSDLPMLLGAAVWSGSLLAVRFRDAYLSDRTGYRPQGRVDDLNALRFAGYELCHQVLGTAPDATSAAIILTAAAEYLFLLERQR